MRKYLAIILGVLFILSFAVVAFAESEITLGGKILIRGWYIENVGTGAVTVDPPGPPPPTTTLGSSNLPIDTHSVSTTSGMPPVTTVTTTDQSSQALYTTNANITIDAKVSDNVRGFMELETTVGNAGNANTGLFYWGSCSGAVCQDTKPASDLFFRQLWIQYTGSGLLGVPSGIKVGHMPITLGEKQFLNNERFGDDAILLWTDPTKELHLAIGTAKLQEGTTTLGLITNTDDIDGYLLIGTYKLDKDNTIGANYTWIHSDGLGSPATVEDLNFHNLGLHANGKVAGLSYAAEADIQFGKIENFSPAEDEDFGGWAIFAKLGYMLDPVNLRASFAYGSGDDDLTDSDIEEIQTLQGPDAVGPLARWVHYTQIYERTIRTASQDQALTGATRNTSIANTTYYNLGFDVNPVKELTLSLDGFLIYASETPSNVSDNAGSELDFKATYKIAKNLSYFIEAAGFWPGNYYDDTFSIDSKTVTQVVHGISLSF